MAPLSLMQARMTIGSSAAEFQFVLAMVAWLSFAQSRLPIILPPVLRSPGHSGSA